MQFVGSVSNHQTFINVSGGFTSYMQLVKVEVFSYENTSDDPANVIINKPSSFSFLLEKRKLFYKSMKTLFYLQFGKWFWNVSIKEVKKYEVIIWI